MLAMADETFSCYKTDHIIGFIFGAYRNAKFIKIIEKK